MLLSYYLVPITLLRVKVHAITFILIPLSPNRKTCTSEEKNKKNKKQKKKTFLTIIYNYPDML